MPDLAEALKSALNLNADDRAAVAERLLASLDDLDEEESDRLWALKASNRLDVFRAARCRLARMTRQDRNRTSWLALRPDFGYWFILNLACLLVLQFLVSTRRNPRRQPPSRECSGSSHEFERSCNT